MTVDGLPAAGHRWHPPHNTEYGLNAVHDEDTDENPVIFSLSEGLHTVSFHIREDGTRLDRIELVLVNANPNSSNTPPTVTLIANQTNTEGEIVNLQVSANDADGDSVTYSQSGLPQQLSLNSGTGEITGVVTEAGTYNVTITVDDNNGGIDTESFTWVVNGVTTPPTGPVEIFVEIEDYNLGGEGVGYHDDNQRQGNYNNGRGETVDLERASDGGTNDVNVGYVRSGEWLAYDIDIPVAGTYQLDMRTARNTPGNGGFHLEIDGNDITDTLATPHTGGWQTYQTTSYSNIAFEAGLQTVRMVFDVNSFNVNWFRLTLEQASATQAPSGDFVGIGSEWKYLDDGSDQGSAWRGTSFNDSSWSSGLAQLGFGDGDENTILSFGNDANNKHITTYFRKSFSVQDAASITELSFDIVRDDGAVVYLNGTEVIRSNMPAGTITYTTLAPTGTAGADESRLFTHTVDPSVLVNGTNVIAVEVHQNGPTSSDLSFDLRLSYDTTTGGDNTPPPPPANNSPVANNASINVAHNTVTSGTLTGSDADGDTLSFSWVSNGTKGSVTVNTDGSFTYTPNNGESGTDSFTFRVNDGQDNSNVATVSVTIAEAPVPENDPPTTQSGGTFTVTVDNASFGGVLQGSDPNGDAITYELVGLPPNGTVTLDPITGEYSYVNTSGANGTDGFSFVVVDEHGSRSPLRRININIIGGVSNPFSLPAGVSSSINFVDLPTISGSTDGQYSIGQDGQASYTIPIFTPPGPGGLQPELVFNLFTMGGGTFMGLGAGLGGLSAITRCAKTIATDGEVGGVNFDSDDRFCLEGQRLIAVSGTYGGNGTEYRTELDTFSRIISRTSSAARGPDSFEVWTKSGNRMVFGGVNDDSAIKAQGTSIVSTWAVNRVMDAANNSFDVTYNQDEATGEYYPLSIRYGAVQRIDFIYQSRSDAFRGYQAGSKISSTVLLRGVRSYRGALAREYRLSYNTSTTSNRTRLASIQECTVSHCFRPTTLSWEDGSIELGGSVTLPSTFFTISDPTSQHNSTEFGDFNGDGFTDILEVVAARNDFRADLYVHLNDTRGNFVDTRTGSGAGTASVWWGDDLSVRTSNRRDFIDFNNDGMTDILNHRRLRLRDVWRLTMLISEGDRFMEGTFDISNLPQQDLDGTSGDDRINRDVLAGDYDGDGRVDMFSHDFANNRLEFYRNNGSGFDAGQVWRNLGSEGRGASGGGRYTAIDVNGDGRADVMRVANNGEAYVWLSQANNTFSQIQTWATGLGNNNGDNPNALSFADFNGDGLSDIARAVRVGDRRFEIRIWLNNGKAFIESGNWRNITATSANSVRDFLPGIRYSDVNGDGLADLLVLAANGGFYITRSTGNGFNQLSVNLGDASIGTNGRNLLLADLNNDAKIDILRRDGDRRRMHLSDPREMPDQLVGITNGYGSEIRFNYGLMTSSALYTPTDDNVSFPVTNVPRVPMRVIESTEVSDGMGGWHRTQYRYVGAKNHQQGRGFLGFKEIATIEDIHMDGSQSITIDTYNQTYPFNGSLTRVKHGL